MPEGGARGLWSQAAACFGLLLAAASPVSAQGKWQPTVSTTASDLEVMRRVAPAAELPVWNDPRYRPLPVITSLVGFAVTAGRVESHRHRCCTAEAQAQAPPEKRSRTSRTKPISRSEVQRAPRTSNRIETGAVDSEPAGKQDAGDIATCTGCGARVLLRQPAAAIWLGA